jgi:hypothetical protein
MSGQVGFKITLPVTDDAWPQRFRSVLQADIEFLRGSATAAFVNWCVSELELPAIGYRHTIYK